MASAVKSESPDEVLASIRRIVAEENNVENPYSGPPQAPVIAEKTPIFSGSAAAAKVEQRRRAEALIEARRRYEQRMANRVAHEPPVRPKPAPKPPTQAQMQAKLLLTEDFQVRGPQQDAPRYADPLSRLQGYTEDSDLPEAEKRPTLESVVRDAVADSVRAALNTSVDLDEEPDFLDEDGYIDVDTLRALVISVVHEELRGELGNQISARVRKLVRQEINRALQVEILELR
ncbi:MAG: hypothetical protein AAGF50_05520 [Pseudomonadota bacterium]